MDFLNSFIGSFRLALLLFSPALVGTSYYFFTGLVRNLRDRHLLTRTKGGSDTCLGAMVFEGKRCGEPHQGAPLAVAFLQWPLMSKEDQTTLIGAADFRLLGSIGDATIQLPREVFTDPRIHLTLDAGCVLSSGNISLIFRDGWHYEHDDDASALTDAVGRFPELSENGGEPELRGAQLFEFEFATDATLTIIGKPLANERPSKSGGAYRQLPRADIVVAPKNNRERLILSDYSPLELAKVLRRETTQYLAYTFGFLVLGIAAGAAGYALTGYAPT